jgi:hypothetical protein
MNHTVILDANLLVLLVVGSTQREYITKHKRLASYAVEEFDLLMTLLDEYS